MDAYRPGYGKVYERFYPGRHGLRLSLGVQRLPADDQVEQQVDVENNHVPEQERLRGRVEENVKDACGLAQIDKYEKEDHHGGRDGKKFSRIS